MRLGIRLSIPALLALLACAHADLRAQGYYAFVTYNTGLPTSSMASFVGGYSFTGIGLDAGLLLGRRLSAGATIGWNVFDEDTDGVLTFDNGAISGTQSRFVNIAPVMATARYDLKTGGGMRPYLGLGLGLYFVDRISEFGQFRFQDKNWHLGVAPQLGFTFPLGSGITGFADARYNRAFAAGPDNRSYSYLGINFGLGFRYR
ncbi:MAG: hypothetical protein ACREM1_07320 [Longimicrobiales bacterium]